MDVDPMDRFGYADESRCVPPYAGLVELSGVSLTGVEGGPDDMGKVGGSVESNKNHGNQEGREEGEEKGDGCGKASNVTPNMGSSGQEQQCYPNHSNNDIGNEQYHDPIERDATPFSQNTDRFKRPTLLKLTGCDILRDSGIVESDTMWILDGKIVDPTQMEGNVERFHVEVLDLSSSSHVQEEQDLQRSATRCPRRNVLVVPGFIDLQLNGKYFETVNSTQFVRSPRVCMLCVCVSVCVCVCENDCEPNNLNIAV
jgi:hypothetical protein